MIKHKDIKPGLPILSSYFAKHMSKQCQMQQKCAKFPLPLALQKLSGFVKDFILEGIDKNLSSS